MLDREYIRGLARYLDANPCLDFDTRSGILYPLLDEIYEPNQVLEIELKCGLRLSYLYRSNIAKEILLREAEKPDHAWEPMTTMAVRLALDWQDGSVLIGGAYFGDHALVAAKQMQSKEQHHTTICVEPNPEQRALLLDNAKANDLEERLDIIPSILWEREGELFELEATDSHAAAKRSSNSGISSTTVDQLTSTLSVDKLALVLLDIEGSEEAALRGASTWLAKPISEAPIIIVEVHRHYVDWSNGLKDTSIVRLLKEHGYKVYALRDCQSNQDLGIDKPEIIPLQKVYLEGPPHGFNLICCKDDAFFGDDRFRIVTDVSPKYLRHRDPKLHAPLP